MSLHKSTFAYLTPTEEQIDQMETVRKATLDYSIVLDQLLPEGADKTYLMRKLREINSWAMITLTRHSDGTPRVEGVKRLQP